MARDYVRRSPPKQKAGAKKRTGGRGRAPERRTPWLAILSALTLFAGLGYIIFLIKGSADERQVAEPPAVHQPAPIKKVNPIDQKPIEKWEYIKELENKKVVVSTPPPANERKKPDAKPKIYYMQCGSFRSSAQAERLKARIALQQGLSSEVKRSEGSNGVWYRVVMGPYPSKRKADQEKHKLSRINTSCILLRG